MTSGGTIPPRLVAYMQVLSSRRICVRLEPRTLILTEENSTVSTGEQVFLYLRIPLGMNGSTLRTGGAHRYGLDPTRNDRDAHASEVSRNG